MVKICNLILAIILSINFAFADSTNIFDKWNTLDKNIAQNKIDRAEALKQLKKCIDEANTFFYMNNYKSFHKSDWVFPLNNYSKIYFRNNGKDYNDIAYDYFDGNKSWNHPATDIMIADSNKDCLDDITGKFVDVVSISGGIVVATDTLWELGSVLRAGKYIRIFDITNQKLFYYSHLNSVYKKPGDIIKPGDKIGEVGRTGRQTILPVNITHLHIALLKFENEYPTPEPLIDELKRTIKQK